MSKGRKVPPAIDHEALAKEIISARDAALLSLDEAQIRAYYLQYNGFEMSADPLVFWLAVHKARTGMTSLPMEARQLSKRYLLERGSKSLDNGEVEV